jgi:hypothetical protein
MTKVEAFLPGVWLLANEEASELSAHLLDARLCVYACR